MHLLCTASARVAHIKVGNKSRAFTQLTHEGCDACRVCQSSSSCRACAACEGAAQRFGVGRALRHCSQQPSARFYTQRRLISLPYFPISPSKGVFPPFEELKLEKGTNLSFRSGLRLQAAGFFFLSIKRFGEVVLDPAPPAQEAGSPHESGVAEQLWSSAVWGLWGQRGSILGTATEPAGDLGTWLHSVPCPLWLGTICTTSCLVQKAALGTVEHHRAQSHMVSAPRSIPLAAPAHC